MTPQSDLICTIFRKRNGKPFYYCRDTTGEVWGQGYVGGIPSLPEFAIFRIYLLKGHDPVELFCNRFDAYGMIEDWFE